jgi:hypothetical protein
MGRPSHIFLSYSWADGRGFASALCDALQAGSPSHKIWCDLTNLRAGGDSGFDSRIDDAITDCKAFIYVMTVDSVSDASFCRKEVARAQELGRPVLALKLHAGIQLPAGLLRKNNLDLCAPHSRCVEELLGGQRGTDLSPETLSLVENQPVDRVNFGQLQDSERGALELALYSGFEESFRTKLAQVRTWARDLESPATQLDNASAHLEKLNKALRRAQSEEARSALMQNKKAIEREKDRLEALLEPPSTSFPPEDEEALAQPAVVPHDSASLKNDPALQFSKWAVGIFSGISALALILILKWFSGHEALFQPLTGQTMAVTVMGAAALALGVLYLIRFYYLNSYQFERDYQLDHGNYDWVIWPAIGMNKIFTVLFGNNEPRLKSLITWRSVAITSLLSIVTNFVTLYLIISYSPDDMPDFGRDSLKILFNSHLVFVAFNCLGDWVSITVTRYSVAMIISRRYKLLRYLALDILGILMGYCVTMSPAFIVSAYCIITKTNLNPWIHTGLIGPIIIPFFLFIFATTNMPLIFSALAFMAVFSVTVPTALYLLLIVGVFVLYKLHKNIWLGGRNDDLVFETQNNRYLRIGSAVIFSAKIVLISSFFAEVYLRHM